MPEEKRLSETNGMQGLAFGIMEGTILLMGLMLGLSVTKSRTVTLIALLVTALADSFANSAGFHVSQEAEAHHKKREVWASTIFCFIGTFSVMSLLAAPIMFFKSYSNAIAISSAIAIVILGSLGVFVARHRHESALATALEYISIGVFVAVVCFFLGEFAESVIGP